MSFSSIFFIFSVEVALENINIDPDSEKAHAQNRIFLLLPIILFQNVYRHTLYIVVIDTHCSNTDNNEEKYFVLAKYS